LAIHAKLPEMLSFENVPVVPCKPVGSKGNTNFGPVWPDWENQIIARHCRSNIPTDKIPEISSEAPMVIEEPMIWGGVLHRHFGHFIAEIAPRILQSLRDGTGDKFLYAVESRIIRTQSWDDVPGHFRPIINWLGLREENVEFCMVPMLVKQLEVAVQAEQLGRKNTPGEYLDLLDENTLRNNLTPVKNKYVFVSRARMPAHLGSHAAPDFFDATLAKLGVEIFYPEKHSLRDQLAVYAGAEHLIFAQGSAVHGLQLLGRGLKSVSVLNRSPETNMAILNLAPRCEQLNYINVAAYYFNLDGRRGIPIPRDGKAIFDTDALFKAFGALGLDLAKVWDQAEYMRAVNENLRIWLDASIQMLARRGYYGKQTRLIEDLRKSEFEDMSIYANSLIEKYSEQ